MIKVTGIDFTYGFDYKTFMSGLKNERKCKFQRHLTEDYWNVYLKDKAVESELIKELRGW